MRPRRGPADLRGAVGRTTEDPSRRTGVRPPLAALCLYVMLFALQMLVLLLLSPRLFWVDDAMTQYSPAMWWLGRHQAGLLPPLMNPELGGAASFATDMQYGVLDPMHWIWQAVASRYSDVATFAALYGCASLFLVGSGVLVQLLLRRVPPVLAASVAVGVSSSGFLLWFGSNWWPLALSAGWICWIWNGLRMRSWTGLLVLGLATGAFLTSGYPYFISFAGVLVVMHLVEGTIASRSWRVLVDHRHLMQYAALAGGLVYALPTVLTMLESLPLIVRPAADPLLGNSGLGVPNLVDVVLGSPTLIGDTGFPTPGPWTVTYTFVITVPLVALIRWDRFLRVPGALVGATVAVLAAGATQLPAVVLGFRHPFLYLTVVEIFLPITLILLVVHARAVTRRRVVAAASIVAAQVLLTIVRAPHFLAWSIAGLVVLAAALAALLIHLTPRRGRGLSSRSIVWWSATTALAVLAISPGMLSMGTLMQLQNAQEDLGLVARFASAARQPSRSEPGYAIDPPTVSTFVRRSIAPGGAASVYDFHDYEDGDTDTMFRTGAFAGNENLFADASLGYGYPSAVEQEDRAAHECRGRFGAACAPELLLAAAPATGERWIDLLSQPVVLVNADGPTDVVTYLRRHWNETVAPEGWLRFQKRDVMPGRITAVHGVRVASSGWATGLGRIGGVMEHYTVSTGATSGDVVFYTTYWPGLQATVDGSPVPVSSLEGSVLQVDLPPGLDRAGLEISYAPIGSRLIALVVVGPAIVLLVAVAALVLARRRRRPGDGIVVASPFERGSPRAH